MKLIDFWPTSAAITKCIPSEAEVISEEAFLAVHQPIRLLRRSLTNASTEGEATDERKVLDALLKEFLPEGYVIVPVVGPSGVGKSHLIRWLGLHVPREKMHVILIPKNTRLRKILEMILDGLQGDGYEEIRNQLATAREAHDEIAARNLLLAHFRTALERLTRAAEEECIAIARLGEKPPGELAGLAQTHGPGLVALLEGPTKEALLQDDTRKSVLRTLITRVTTGIIAAENAEFTADDFKFDNINPARLSSDLKLQNYVKKLKANLQNDRANAARFMNEVRDGAVSQLLGFGENQLEDLFRRVREELYKDGKELVLLIEDFTTLAGVQRGLLDVIKMEGVHGGEAERCHLRTALALTEGFLSPFDTIKTRVVHEFVLREQPAADEELLATITDMVGAYLNAARLGPEMLKEWFERVGRSPDAAPPSFEYAARDLSDPDRKALEAFGKSVRGHSLFPFNRAAVKQLALQHLAAGGPIRLNPRALIKDVLHATLLYQREAFESGRFPPEDFHRFNPNKLGPDVNDWLFRLQRADSGRYAVLLGYWGDQPRQPNDVKLPAQVYTAFNLVPLTGAEVEHEGPKPISVPPTPPVPISPEAKDKTSTAIEERLKILEVWTQSKKITQRDAQNLRNDLLDMIDAAIDWDALLFIPRNLSSANYESEETEAEEEEIEKGFVPGTKYKKARLREAVGSRELYLPFNPDKTSAGPDDSIFTLCREEVFEKPEAFTAIRLELRALVRFHAHKSFDYPDGDVDRAWYARLAERASAEAVVFLRNRYERVPDNKAAVAAVAQALYVSARVLDLPGAHSNADSEVLKAVLHPGPGNLPQGHHGEQWHTFRKDCADKRAISRDFLLRRLAARQGSGHKLYGIDANRLLDLLKPVRMSCRVELNFPGEVAKLEENAQQVFLFVSQISAKRTDSAVAERRAVLANWAANTREWLGTPFDKKSFVAEAVEVINQASNLGVFQAEVDHNTLRRYAKEFEEASVSEAIATVDSLKEAEGSPSKELTIIVKARDEPMRTAEIFRTAFQVFQKQTLARARSELAKKLRLADADEDADPDSLLPSEAEKLDSDLRILMITAGGTPEDLPATTVAPVTTQAVPQAEMVPPKFGVLRETLNRLSQTETIVEQLKQLEPIRSAVNEWAVELPKLVFQHRLFFDRDDMKIDDAPDGAKLVNAVTAARTKVASGPLEITSGRTFTNLNNAVQKVIEAYRTTIDTAWKAWVEKNAPRIDDAELAPFEADPGYRDTVVDLKRMLATLRRHKNEPAEATEGFQKVEGLIDNLRELLERLPITAPDEVKKFLAATNSREGAPIDLLTESVSQWLRANNQTNKYRIRR